jgi:hypothetical protein
MEVRQQMSCLYLSRSPHFFLHFVHSTCVQLFVIEPLIQLFIRVETLLFSYVKHGVHRHRRTSEFDRMGSVERVLSLSPLGLIGLVELVPVRLNMVSRIRYGPR